MARTRLRSIAVDGVDYRWTVAQIDPGHVMVKIWHGERQAGGALEVVVIFDDPWLNYGPMITAPAGRAAEVFVLDPIVPSLIADIIRLAIDEDWQPGGSATARFQLTRDRGRLQPSPEE